MHYLRLVLISILLGAAVGVAAFFLMCVRPCGGVAEAINSIIVGVGAAFVLCVYLILRSKKLRLQDPKQWQSEGTKQWIWFGISAFVLLFILVLSNG